MAGEERTGTGQRGSEPASDPEAWLDRALGPVTMRSDGALARGLHLLALSSFAVAQPLLDVLGLQADFFVAHLLSAREVVGLVLALLLLPPALLWGLERGVGLIATRLEAALHRIFVAVLVTLTALPPLVRAELPAPASLALTVALGAAASVAYARLRALRNVATWLALAPLVFAAVFFSRHDVVSLVLRGVDVDLGVIHVENPLPIVIVVFDELPLTSLLDENDGIDPIRYPSFARLARGSWWLRRASTIDLGTLQSVPAMLTGVVPGERRRPATAAAHPRNFLRVLEPHYAMNVIEPMTMLYGREPKKGPASPRGSLVLDVAVIYLHVILPDPLAARLPPIDVGWGSFARDHMFWGQGMQGRSTIFRSFVASLEKQERPGFHFLHIQLPHMPWHYLPSGYAYSPFGWFTPNGRYLRDPSWANDAWQRHLLQVGFVDLLLGELLDRLEELDLYDECLLVVTSDHGISFWPGRRYRSLEDDDHPEDVLAVPLLIKLPNQRRGKVSWRNVQSIDIAPTIADVIGLELPWEMDGCSVLDESCPERPTKLAFRQQTGRPGFNQRLEFDPAVVLRPDSLRRKLALFGSGSTPGALYRFGPFQQLVGRRVEDLGPIGEAQWRAVLDPMQRIFPIGDEDELVPVRVSGVIRLPPEVRQRLHVAVAVGGVIQTVVAAPRFGRSHRLAAMIPEDAVREGRAEMALYLVTGSGDSPSLKALPTERSGEASRWRW